MKKLLIIFSFISVFCNASIRYEVSGGTGNYNSTTNWSLTSGGSSGAAFPTSSDSAVFDTHSGNLTINTASAALNITFNTYTNTITWNSTLTSSGSVTFGSGMSFTTTTGSPILSMNASGTITSNGIHFPYQFSVSGPNITLGDDMYCSTFFVGSTVHLINSHNIYASASFTSLGDLTTTSYVINVNMVGTGTISGGFRIGCGIVINTAGTITISSTLDLYLLSSLTVTAGTVLASTSNILCESSTSINAPSVTFKDMLVYNSSILTLNSDVTFNGTVTMSIGTIAGAHNMTMNNFVITAGTNQIQAGQTYSVSGLLSSLGSSGTHYAIKSSSTSVRAILTLTGTQNMRFCNGTWIDSSNGKQIKSFGGILSNTINWNNKITNFNTFN